MAQDCSLTLWFSQLELELTSSQLHLQSLSMNPLLQADYRNSTGLKNTADPQRNLELMAASTGHHTNVRLTSISPPRYSPSKHVSKGRIWDKHCDNLASSVVGGVCHTEPRKLASMPRPTSVPIRSHGNRDHRDDLVYGASPFISLSTQNPPLTLPYSSTVPADVLTQRPPITLPHSQEYSTVPADVLTQRLPITPPHSQGYSTVPADVLTQRPPIILPHSQGYSTVPANVLTQRPPIILPHSQGYSTVCVDVLTQRPPITLSHSQGYSTVPADVLTQRPPIILPHSQGYSTVPADVLTQRPPITLSHSQGYSTVPADVLTQCPPITPPHSQGYSTLPTNTEHIPAQYRFGGYDPSMTTFDDTSLHLNLESTTISTNNDQVLLRETETTRRQPQGTFTRLDLESSRLPGGGGGGGGDGGGGGASASAGASGTTGGGGSASSASGTTSGGGSAGSGDSNNGGGDDTILNSDRPTVPPGVDASTQTLNSESKAIQTRNIGAAEETDSGPPPYLPPMVEEEEEGLACHGREGRDYDVGIDRRVHRERPDATFRKTFLGSESTRARDIGVVSSRARYHEQDSDNRTIHAHYREQNPSLSNDRIPRAHCDERNSHLSNNRPHDERNSHIISNDRTHYHERDSDNRIRHAERDSDNRIRHPHYHERDSHSTNDQTLTPIIKGANTHEKGEERERDELDGYQKTSIHRWNGSFTEDSSDSSSSSSSSVDSLLVRTLNAPRNGGMDVLSKLRATSTSSTSEDR